ncbi:MAG: response regulator transcription factor [Acidobacteria bacterium]|nr:response regulator transcription factor [Acidobacteriota bacterium]
MTSPTVGPIRVLVADDELPARQRLFDLLHKDSGVGTISQAENGAIAVEMIRTQRPDILFLDVQMPELDGLGVIDAIGANEMPLTVFVTAYDEHAIRAFEANALDYLLKPFSDERFEATMARIKTRLNERGMREFGMHVLEMVSREPSHEQFLDRLVVKAAGTTRFVRAADIEWIEAAGVYVTLHVGAKEVLYRAALNDLARKLDPMRFVRVHRSAIVNIESVSHLQPISHGEFEVVMKSGTRSKISRTYRAGLEKRLGQSL